MKRLIVLVAVFIVVGCSSDVEPTPGAESEATSTHTQEATVPPNDVQPTPMPPPQPTLLPNDVQPTPIPTSQPAPRIDQGMVLVTTGDAEIVFDWTTDSCEPESIPDITTRAFRDADGQINLTIGHYVNYSMRGPDFDNLTSDCSAPTLASDFDPDPSQFNDSEWIGSVYTEDGQTVYAIIHNEYRGATHPNAFCPSGDNLTCLDTSVTMAISRDGGRTFEDILAPPNHMIATLPYVYSGEGVPSGLRQPSNIIEGPEGYFYVFTNVSDYPPVPGQFPPQRACVMRTENLDDPSSWRYWDGEGFNGQFINPYTTELTGNEPICEGLDLAVSIQEGIVYDTELDIYVMVGLSENPYAPGTQWGVYYSLSDDLINWTRRELLLEIPTGGAIADPDNDSRHAYPSIIDHDSASISFNTMEDGDAYLYISRFNFGGNSLDRDLLRFPIQWVSRDDVANADQLPDWQFDTDGDTQGWVAINQVEAFTAAGSNLSMRSTGNDPYIHSSEVSVPADTYNSIEITMRLEPQGEAAFGQLFFITESDILYDDPKSIGFELIPDGAYHTYQLDMAGVPAWEGIIKSIRLDPMDTAGLIEIDAIAFSEDVAGRQTAWQFDTDGDTEGWQAANQLQDFITEGGLLTMRSTGGDPYMESSEITIPADTYITLEITMRLEESNASTGQIFFVTDVDPNYSEGKSLIFDLIPDGGFHTYSLKMSRVSTWSDIIKALRIDPMDTVGLIEIDSIVFSE